MQHNDLVELLNSKIDHSPNPNTFDFSIALVHLKQGRAVYRLGWNGNKIGLPLFVAHSPEDNGMSGEDENPYLIYFNGRTSWIGWIPSIMDLFAEDWALRFKKDTLDTPSP